MFFCWSSSETELLSLLNHTQKDIPFHRGIYPLITWIPLINSGMSVKRVIFIGVPVPLLLVVWTSKQLCCSLLNGRQTTDTDTGGCIFQTSSAALRIPHSPVSCTTTSTGRSYGWTNELLSSKPQPLFVGHSSVSFRGQLQSQGTFVFLFLCICDERKTATVIWWSIIYCHRVSVAGQWSLVVGGDVALHLNREFGWQIAISGGGECSGFECPNG